MPTCLLLFLSICNMFLHVGPVTQCGVHGLFLVIAQVCIYVCVASRYVSVTVRGLSSCSVCTRSVDFNQKEFQDVGLILVPRRKA